MEKLSFTREAWLILGKLTDVGRFTLWGLGGFLEKGLLSLSLFCV